MDRPRIAAIVSGAAASAAAFVVVSRSSLLGTPVGAAIAPVVYTLVSYVSSVGLDRAGEWLQFRTPVRDRAKHKRSEKLEQRGFSAEELPGQPVRRPEGEGAGESKVVSYYRTPGRRRLNPQWLLAGSAFVALATSIYAVASPQAVETVEKVVVQRQVIEKTVTVTTEAEITPTRSEAGATAADDPATSSRTSTAAGPVANDTPAASDDEDATSTTGASTDDGSGGADTSPTTQPAVEEIPESGTPTTEPSPSDDDPGQTDDGAALSTVTTTP
ncbi:MAG: hypothetical protein JXA87_09660 [Thermoleophilia bacterium]|nr:hypothetical protein [Thermoleophilia bacterium]